jgi:lysophospholipase L1-like esterase
MNHNLKNRFSMLSLGDSYTVGEAVEQALSFPFLTVTLLRQNNFDFGSPMMLAKTGWSTDELASAIEQANFVEKFDVVTLLIGVNNQYRNRSLDNFRQEFCSLLHTAISLSKHGAETVFVLSIPDWSVTPFLAQDVLTRSSSDVASQIDAFNEVKKDVSMALGVTFIDITPISRLAGEKKHFIASDGLHPSGAMYQLWAEKLANAIIKKMRTMQAKSQNDF